MSKIQLANLVSPSLNIVEIVSSNSNIMFDFPQIFCFTDIYQRGGLGKGRYQERNLCILPPNDLCLLL